MVADYKTNYLGIGKNKDIIQAIVHTYDRYKVQVSDLVADLVDQDYDTQCETIWTYFNDNVRYYLDKENYQFFKTPARLLADGSGDCKSFSIFFGSCFHNLNIPFVFRFVSFGGKYYTHVYVVAYPGTSDEIIFDAVEKDANDQPIYNYARPFVKKLDIPG